MTENERILAVLREVWPEKAAEIERALTQPDGTLRSDVKIKVGVRYRLEKFDGDYADGKKPVEVIEGEDNIGDDR